MSCAVTVKVMRNWQRKSVKSISGLHDSGLHFVDTWAAEKMARRDHGSRQTLTRHQPRQAVKKSKLVPKATYGGRCLPLPFAYCNKMNETSCSAQLRQSNRVNRHLSYSDSLHPLMTSVHSKLNLRAKRTTKCEHSPSLADFVAWALLCNIHNSIPCHSRSPCDDQPDDLPEIPSPSSPSPHTAHLSLPHLLPCPPCPRPSRRTLRQTRANSPTTAIAPSPNFRTPP